MRSSSRASASRAAALLGERCVTAMRTPPTCATRTPWWKGAPTRASSTLIGKRDASPRWYPAGVSTSAVYGKLRLRPSACSECAHQPLSSLRPSTSTARRVTHAPMRPSRCGAPAQPSR
eukprot:2681193-Prymnesium_polylepis.1